MQKFASLPDAIALAEFAHRSQLDKAGLPYIEHPKRVLAKVQAQGALPYVQIAAILHDVTEDTHFTPEMLLELGFSEAAVDVVERLDRDRSKQMYSLFSKYDSVEDFYYGRIKEHPGALMVKLADIEDNLSPWRLSYLPGDTQRRLRRKYHYAKLILEHGFAGKPAAIANAMKNWDEMNPEVV